MRLFTWLLNMFDPKRNELESIKARLLEFENTWHKVNTNCTDEFGNPILVTITSSDGNKESEIL